MTNQNFTLTVTKFNSIVKDIFNAEELLHNIKISGEVFGISLSKNSVYFSIKDEECTLPCVSFYGNIMKDIKEGDSVVITGSPNFYAKSGRFNFVVSKIEPFGLGVLYQRFLAMKEKLEREGLFDDKNKKPMPKTIKRIGVITSKDGAVIQDIKNVVWRRDSSVDIVLFSTKVQGNLAEQEIANAIKFFSEYAGVDVIIVGRGGGSLEDLAAYNTEEVARAIFDCQKPIVSAVGHESDFTIADFVADLRAPTPSAAAELLTKDTKSNKTAFVKEVQRLSRMIDLFVAEKQTSLQSQKTILFSKMEKDIFEKDNLLKKISAKLANKIDSTLMQAKHNAEIKISALQKLNPLDILGRGYAKIEQNENPIAKKSELDLEKEITINFADGKIFATAKKEK